MWSRYAQRVIYAINSVTNTHCHQYGQLKSPVNPGKGDKITDLGGATLCPSLLFQTQRILSTSILELSVGAWFLGEAMSSDRSYGDKRLQLEIHCIVWMACSVSTVLSIPITRGHVCIRKAKLAGKDKFEWLVRRLVACWVIFWCLCHHEDVCSRPLKWRNFSRIVLFSHRVVSSLRCGWPKYPQQHENLRHLSTRRIDLWTSPADKVCTKQRTRYKTTAGDLQTVLQNQFKNHTQYHSLCMQDVYIHLLSFDTKLEPCLKPNYTQSLALCSKYIGEHCHLFLAG